MFRFSFAVMLLALLLAAGLLGQAAPEPAQIPPAPIEVAQVVSSCDALITRAMETAGVSCGSLDRNEACYGNNLVKADIRPDTTASFVTTGDIAPLLSLQKVITAPLDEAAQTWGIAVFKAQANIPDTLPGQNVTFLLFGDTTVDNPSPDMRAVTISTGIGQLACNNAPPSALLIQSPEGQKVAMNINGAEVTLGSTVYLTSVINDRMTLATIEGGASITAFGVTQQIVPGAQVELPLGEVVGATGGLAVIGPPGPPEPFDTSGLARIPLQLLPRPVLLPLAISGNEPATPTPTATIPGTCTPRADWTFTYAIQSGDTLSGIAARAQITLAELAAGNCITNIGVIRAGQVLVVPNRVSAPPPRPTTPPSNPGSSNPPPDNNPPQDNNPPPQGEPTGPNFRADDQRVKQGDCTTIRWDADNIKEIYFENQGVIGHGSKQVCPRDTSSYTLVVIWPDNSEHRYGLRVVVLGAGATCGDGVCDAHEDSSSCSADCGKP